jgi:hypothetical protein
MWELGGCGEDDAPVMVEASDDVAVQSVLLRWQLDRPGVAKPEGTIELTRAPGDTLWNGSLRIPARTVLGRERLIMTLTVTDEAGNKTFRSPPDNLQNEDFFVKSCQERS